GVLKELQSRLGPEHPGTLISRGNLAIAFHEAGRTAEAIELFEETLPVFVSKFGPNHPETLTTRNNLAFAILNLGRTAEAIALHTETWKRREAALGPAHPATLSSRENLASAYGLLGRWTEAETELRKCLEAREKAQPDDWSHFNTMSLLGGALLGQGKYA